MKKKSKIPDLSLDEQERLKIATRLISSGAERLFRQMVIK
jgi:hypothetical protein